MAMKKTAQDYIFVGLQLMLFAGYVFEWLPRVKVPAAVTVSGMALAVLGLAIAVFSVINLNRSLTVFPTPKKEPNLLSLAYTDGYDTRFIPASSWRSLDMQQAPVLNTNSSLPSVCCCFSI